MRGRGVDVGHVTDLPIMTIVVIEEDAMTGTGGVIHHVIET